MSPGHRPAVNRFNPVSLYKLIIPASCLVFIGWIWLTMTGS